jgi:hypothetical protein
MLNMSAEDFGHYLIAQLNGGSYQGVSLLSPTGIAELHHPNIQMPSSTDFYAMGWEVQQYQDVQVIGHNGAVPGYTTGMFLVPEKDLAVALVMNTYSPMLGVRVSRLPSSVLLILLGQEIIPGYEFPYMRIVYALVMLILLLQIIAVFTTLRRIGFWRRTAQLPMQMQVAPYVALPFFWNAAIAYGLLVTLPSAFGAKMSVILLFQPDVGWVALISGVFAIVWGLLRTGVVVSTLRQASERQKKN